MENRTGWFQEYYLQEVDFDEGQEDQKEQDYQLEQVDQLEQTHGQKQAAEHDLVERQELKLGFAELEKMQKTLVFNKIKIIVIEIVIETKIRLFGNPNITLRVTIH